MVDPEDDYGHTFVVDLVDHPIRPASSRPESGKFALERVTNPTRCFDEPGEHEFDDRRRNALGQSGQRPFRGGSNDKTVFRDRHLSRYLARRSSALSTRPSTASA